MTINSFHLLHITFGKWSDILIGFVFVLINISESPNHNGVTFGTIHIAFSQYFSHLWLWFSFAQFNSVTFKSIQRQGSYYYITAVLSELTNLGSWIFTFNTDAVLFHKDCKFVCISHITVSVIFVSSDKIHLVCKNIFCHGLYLY